MSSEILYTAASSQLSYTRQVLKIYETEKVFVSHEMNIGDIRTAVSYTHLLYL